MKPREKSPALEEALQTIFGVNRERSIMDDRCIEAPIGCGKPIQNFSLWSEMEKEEYTISGLCKDCQHKIFQNADS